MRGHLSSLRRSERLQEVMRQPTYNRHRFRFDTSHFGLWDRFWFWMSPLHITLDFGYSRVDTTEAVYFKRYKGKIYFLGRGDI